MILRWTIAAALVLSVQTARADALGDVDTSVLAAIARIPRPETYRLRNGLEVVIQPLPRQPRVAVVMNYHVGSRDETPELRGLAHLVEHMTFRGSRHMGMYDAISLVEGDGGSMNATAVDADSTHYAAVIPAPALPRALWLESERLGFTLDHFSSESLEQERTVIADERALRGGPALQLEQEFRKALFGERHPYTPAYEHELESVELGDVQSFFLRYYRPDNATLVIAGGVDPAIARDQVERYFGPIWNASPPPAPRAVVLRVEPKPAHRLRFQTTGFTQLFAARWLMLDLTPREAEALRLLVALMNQRLTRVLVRHNAAAGVVVQLEPHPHTCVLGINALVAADQAMGPLEFALREELERIWSSDLSRELEAEKKLAVLREVLLLEDPLAYAMSTVASIDTWGRPFDIQAEIDLTRSIAAADVMRLRPRFLHPFFAWVPHVKRRKSTLF